MRRVKPSGYDLFDRIPTPPKAVVKVAASMMISPNGTKRTGISNNDKKKNISEIAGSTSATGIVGLAAKNEGKQREVEDSDLTREEFGRLLEKVGLGEDQMLIDNINE